MSGPFVVTAYPLSHAFRSQLEEHIGARADYLDVPALRRMSMRELLRKLRSYAGRPCVIAFEDPASQALQPILQFLAAAAGASQAEAISADGTSTRLSRMQLLGALAALGRASVDGAVAALTSRRDLRRLLDAPRVDVAPAGSGRIAYVNANLWFGVKAGGSVGHIAGVVNGLRAHGLDVDLFSVSEPVLIADDVRYRPLYPPRVLALPLELNFPRFQRSVAARVSTEANPPYDFVYQRLTTATFTGVSIARRLRAPLVLEYNGSEVWVARHWGRPLRYERYALDAEEASLRHAHVVVTVSSVLRDELFERGVAPERVVWYPNGVDEHIYDPGRFTEEEVTDLRASHDINADATVVTFVGTFGRWHGVDVLARAVAQLVARETAWLERSRAHFLFVGDGLRMAEVRELLGCALDTGHVTLTGLVPQAEGPRYLAASDIVVSPHVPNADGTPFFGSPTKLFEYMAMGKGIVASALDQIGDVLAGGLPASALPSKSPGEREDRLAVLSTPGSVHELAAGIRFLVDRPDWRRVLGANARREALERYTWRRHVGTILDGVAAMEPPIARSSASRHSGAR